MRILLVQTAFFGDVVLSTPVLAALRQEFPSAELWMLTTPAAKQLVERDPLLAGVITFDKNGAERSVGALRRKAEELRRMGFDRAYALQRSARTAVLLWWAGIPHRVGFSAARLGWLFHEQRPRDAALHDVLRNLQIVGDPAVYPQDLRIVAPADHEVTEELRSQILCGRRVVVLVPGSAWRTKMWDWRGYREVARRFAAQGDAVVVVGSAAERPLAELVCGNLPVANLCGKSSMSELVWVISKAAVVVCNDSMALHLASAAKVPTVAIFCATSPSYGFGPWRNEAQVLEVDGLPCKPCSRHGGKHCPTGTWACSQELSPARVFEVARGLARHG